MDAAFLTYAKETSQIEHRQLSKYTRIQIMKSLSYHLATLMNINDYIVPSWGWKSDTHFISSELCIGINVKSLPQPRVKIPFKPYIS